METKYMRRRGGKTHYAVIQALGAPGDIVLLSPSFEASRLAMEEACRILNNTGIAYEINITERAIVFNGKIIKFTSFASYFGIPHQLLIIDEITQCLESLGKVKLITGTPEHTEGVSNGCNDQC